VVKFAVNKDESLKSTIKGVPMKVLTSSQMKKIDRTAIEEIGILGTILMENAGKQYCSWLPRKK